MIGDFWCVLGGFDLLFDYDLGCALVVCGFC